ARVRLRGCLVECGRAVDYNFGRPSITEAQPLAQMSHIRAKNVVKHEGCICRYCHLYIFCATSLTLNSIKAPEDCRNLMEEIVGTLRDRPESACFRVMNSMVDLGEAESRIFVKPKAPVLDHVGWHERAVAFPGSPPRHHEAFRDVWRRGGVRSGTLRVVGCHLLSLRRFRSESRLGPVPRGIFLMWRRGEIELFVHQPVELLLNLRRECGDLLAK
ncbi:hypothetical protein FOZ63_000778, partial [Perkinsus olseni]